MPSLPVPSVALSALFPEENRLQSNRNSLNYRAMDFLCVSLFGKIIEFSSII